jgi:hypothetical protein
MIAHYVNDIRAACNDPAWLVSFKTQLGAQLTIKDMGDMSHLLGMHIARDRSPRLISLDPPKYMRDIMDKHGMTDCKPSSLLVDPGFVSDLARMNSPLLNRVAKDIYPILLGSLQCATVCTYPDHSKTLSILGYAQAQPTEVHLQALKSLKL